MLKLFALFLKAENTANTDYMREKYVGKMREFVERCEMAEELAALNEEKSKKGNWPEFKEKFFCELGKKFDGVLASSEKDKQDNFRSFMK